MAAEPAQDTATPQGDGAGKAEGILSQLNPNDLRRSAAIAFENQNRDRIKAAQDAVKADSDPEPADEANPAQPAVEAEGTGPSGEDAHEEGEAETEGKDPPATDEEADTNEVYVFPVNGEEREVTLDTLIREYQRKGGSDAEVQAKLDKAAKAESDANSTQARLDAQLADLEKTRTDFAERQSHYEQRLEFMDAVMKAATAADATADYDSLKAQGIDPARWQYERTQRQQYYDEIQSELDKIRREKADKHAQAVENFKRQSMTRIREMWGEHTDERLKIARERAIRDGFSPEQIDAQGFDPRIISYAFKAEMHDRAQKSEPARNANGKDDGEPAKLPPKVIRRKRGSKPVQPSAARSKQDALRAALTSGGNVRAKIAKALEQG